MSTHNWRRQRDYRDDWVAYFRDRNRFGDAVIGPNLTNVSEAAVQRAFLQRARMVHPNKQRSNANRARGQAAFQELARFKELAEQAGFQPRRVTNRLRTTGAARYAPPPPPRSRAGSWAAARGRKALSRARAALASARAWVAARRRPPNGSRPRGVFGLRDAMRRL